MYELCMFFKVIVLTTKIKLHQIEKQRNYCPKFRTPK